MFRVRFPTGEGKAVPFVALGPVHRLQDRLRCRRGYRRRIRLAGLRRRLREWHRQYRFLRNRRRWGGDQEPDPVGPLRLQLHQPASASPTTTRSTIAGLRSWRRSDSRAGELASCAELASCQAIMRDHLLLFRDVSLGELDQAQAIDPRIQAIGRFRLRRAARGHGARTRGTSGPGTCCRTRCPRPAGSVQRGAGSSSSSRPRVRGSRVELRRYTIPPGGRVSREVLLENVMAVLPGNRARRVYVTRPL